uniref:Uncharacterized protein n=1 Tax=Nelumbo nucifera TaxID=4432 RepID=A0A822ZQK2_NELNU|nr:TPA_asm: hypothetical protein HUJ06_003436 [Nelumbo nucifera]
MDMMLKLPNFKQYVLPFENELCIDYSISQLNHKVTRNNQHSHLITI